MNVRQAQDGAAAAAHITAARDEGGGAAAGSRAPIGAALARTQLAAPAGAARAVGADPPLGGALGDMVARLGGRAPVRPLHAPLVAAMQPASGGYAVVAVASQALSASSSSPSLTTATPAVTKKELAFLDDKTISIEDKLFRFMILMQQKADDELEQAMKSYEAKKSAAAKNPGSGGSGGGSPAKPDSGGGGLFGSLGDALGGLGKAVLSGAESLAKDLGGPVLAAGATALGMPWLAPVALQIGGPLASTVVGGVASLVGGGSEKPSGAKSTAARASSAPTLTAATASTAKSSSASATKSSSTSDGAFDEKVEAMKLQQLVEKQTTMFNAISNILKAMHDMRMTAIGNIR